MKSIAAAEFVGRNIKPEHVIDVRSPVEFETCHLPGSINIPLDSLGSAKLPSGSEDHTHYFLCASGMRAKKACEMLNEQVKGNLVAIEGGVGELGKQGAELVYGKQVISLERQVRITAGSLVLLGVLLSFIHPAFIGISAFVGAGLVFAGVTDYCGMGLLLAKMPWNRVKGKSS